MLPASFHIIIMWRYDWCQIKNCYLERKQPYFRSDIGIWSSLMDFGGSCSAQKKLELSVIFRGKKVKNQLQEGSDENSI